MKSKLALDQANRPGDPVARSIATFYRRWHNLESTLGKDAGSVLDFDYCPQELCDDPTPYANRLVALDALDSVRDQLSAADPACFANYELLSDKLGGADTYLRALMGEKIPFAVYIKNILGIPAEPLTEGELAGLRHTALEDLEACGIGWNANQRGRYESEFRYGDPARFAAELRKHAEHWVGVVKSELRLEAAPHYSIDEACEDAYWLNWIDGSLGEPIRLRINLHPRTKFMVGSDVSLAAHEIAGHALHILELRESCARGLVDPAAMNMTVHSVELLQMEGLAQTVIQLLGPSPQTPMFRAYNSIQIYHLALKQQAHISVENGLPIAAAIREILKAAPFLEAASVLPDLRDRCRHPLFRAVMFAYYPSYKIFLRAGELSSVARAEFLRLMYRQLWTPSQILEKLDSLDSTAEAPAD